MLPHLKQPGETGGEMLTSGINPLLLGAGVPQYRGDEESAYLGSEFKAYGAPRAPGGCCHGVASQTRTMPSAEPLTRRVPSGLKATLKTVP